MYIHLQDFKGGLDLRKIAASVPAGNLRKARNVHINRGGEIEKRKAFVSKYTLPSGTFGCKGANGSIYVFGSAADPGVPAGVTYQRLQHPDTTPAMTAVVATELFGGAIYCIADFNDGRRLHFYNGTLVDDWLNGWVRSAMTNTNGIANHLKDLIDAHPDYSATRIGATITVVGEVEGRAFDTVVTTVNGGAVNNQDGVVTVTIQPVAPITEVLAVGSFRIVGGSASAGVNKISSVTVNGVTITSAAVDWATSNEVTAVAVAANINANSSSPEYTAVAQGDTVVISAAAGTGSGPNGFIVNVTAAGNVITNTGFVFTITGGTSNPGTNKITSVVVNGTTITTAAVDWTTSHSNTASLLVANINANTGVSGYNAFANGATVMVGKVASDGSTPNYTTGITTGGNVAINGVLATGTLNFTIRTTVANMAGGVSAYAGIQQETEIFITGNFEEFDKFTITITDSVNGPMIFGANQVSGLRASAILAHKSKLYAGVSSFAFFSAVADSTDWSEYADGSGFIAAANDAAGLTEIKAFGVFQQRLAIFGRENLLIWDVDPDPALNRIAQSLPNMGTIAGKSVVGRGEADVYFLADSGIRSAAAAANVDRAEIEDIGTLVDDAVIAAIAADPTNAALAHAIIEPRTGRYWLYLNGTIYVLTEFKGVGIAAWTTYDSTPAFESFTTLSGRVYGRAGNTIYLYGGDNDATYDTCQAEVTLPYVDARTAAHWKEWTGIDFALQGLWEVTASTDPNHATTEDTIARYDRVSMGDLKAGMLAQAPSISLRFTSSEASRAVISSVMLHYDQLEAA